MLAYLLYIVFGFILLAVIGGLILTFLPSATVASLEQRLTKKKEVSKDSHD